MGRAGSPARDAAPLCVRLRPGARRALRRGVVARPGPRRARGDRRRGNARLGPRGRRRVPRPRCVRAPATAIRRVRDRLPRARPASPWRGQGAVLGYALAEARPVRVARDVPERRRRRRDRGQMEPRGRPAGGAARPAARGPPRSGGREGAYSFDVSSYPVVRLRRFRRSATLRSLVRETRLSLDQFVMPLFVAPESLRNDDLPGMARYSVEDVEREVEELVRLGVQAVILFGVPEEKDEQATGAWDEEGIVQRALRALRPRFPGLG